MKEILERIALKTENLIALQGGSYFMCGNDLLNIINQVRDDIENNRTIEKWIICNNMDEFKLIEGKKDIQYWTSNNCQWTKWLGGEIKFPARYKLV